MDTKLSFHYCWKMVPTSMSKTMMDRRHFIGLAQIGREKMPSFHYCWKRVPIQPLPTMMARLLCNLLKKYNKQNCVAAIEQFQQRQQQEEQKQREERQRLQREEEARLQRQRQQQQEECGQKETRRRIASTTTTRCSSQEATRGIETTTRKGGIGTSTTGRSWPKRNEKQNKSDLKQKRKKNWPKRNKKRNKRPNVRSN